LDLLFGTLFFELLDALLGALSFIQGLLLLFPHPPLIAHEDWMP
jgi:hypothetical protein